MGWDTEKYLALFVTESTEHLEALARDVLTLEKAPTAAQVDDAFRHAHSLKGMASSLGFDAIARLAHRLEDLLQKTRETLQPMPRATLDVVLAAVDTMQAQVRAARDHQPVPEASGLERDLERHRAGAPAETSAASTTTGASEPVASSSPTTGVPRWSVKVRISPTSSQPGVRGFLVYKRLSLLGNLFDLKPSLDHVKTGRLPQGLFSFEFEGSAPRAEIEKTIAAIVDVELVSIDELTAVSAREEKVEVPEPPRPVGEEPTRTVRIKTEVLDQFLDASGELLLATSRVRELTRQVVTGVRGPLDEALDRLTALVKDLNDRVMHSRLTPISLVTDRLPRVTRDIARRRGREIDLVITGADIELDRAIVDELGDPVLHILRNAIDHGIELPEERRMRGKSPAGRVEVSVRRQRDRVIVELSDDGRGLDTERLKAVAIERGLLTPEAARTLSEGEALLLCCLPGVSTAGSITDVSGRGVGMDAVKRAIESLGGTLEIESTRMKGTTFRLSLPLTVAMIRLLLVRSASQTFGLPLARVAGVVEAPTASLQSSQSTPVIQFSGQVLPVRPLSELLELPTPGTSASLTSSFVVVDVDAGRLAVQVDALLGQEELVLKPLSRPLDAVAGLSGVTILGDGNPVFILDVARLVSA